MASPHGKVTSRFASWQRSCRFIEAVRLLLHIRGANASLTKLWISAILYSKDGDIMANDKLAEQSMDFAVLLKNYNQKRKALFLIKSEEAEHLLVRIYMKRSIRNIKQPSAMKSLR